MTDEQQKALNQAYVAHLRSGAGFLAAWKAGLSPERARELADFEAKGLRLGLSIIMPLDRWVVQVLLVDQAGGIVTLETIGQPGLLNTSIN